MNITQNTHKWTRRVVLNTEIKINTINFIHVQIHSIQILKYHDLLKKNIHPTKVS